MQNYKTYLNDMSTKSIPWKWILVVVFLFQIKKIIAYFTNPDTSESVKTRQEEISSISCDYSVGISSSKAKELSYKLLDAFNYQVGGALLGGTDKESIKVVFNLMDHDHDFLKVYKEFGLQLYNGQGTGDDSSIIHKLYDNIDLNAWLRAELDFFDFSLNSLIKQKVSNSGLTY
jgi:hypothetical protein